MGPARLRVLHIITRLDRGGSAENTLLTVAGLDPERFDVTLAVGPTAGERSPTETVARDRGVRFVDIEHLVRPPHPLRDILALRQLRRLLAEGFDIVHTHTSKAGVLGRLAAHRAGTQAVVHTPHGHVFYGYHGTVVTGLFVLIERRAARWCHRLIALTSADRDDHLRFGVGSPPQWEVIHSGVDFDRLDGARRPGADVRRALGIDEEAFVVGTLGRLTAVKGQIHLVHAFARLCRLLPHAWLLLIGDGEERESLQAASRQVGMADRIVFAGWRHDVRDVVGALDAFALPSLNEGMGKALVEAMYLGLPVVATRVGGVPELVADGGDGLLVPAADPEALAQALLRLAGDGELRSRLGANASVRAREYSSERMVERIASLYEVLAREKGLVAAQADPEGELRGEGVAAVQP